MTVDQPSPACALILAGGSGTRFWPLSRQQRPKQLLGLMGKESLLQGTVQRLEPLVQSERVFYSTTTALSELVEADLSVVQIGPAEDFKRRILAEPMGRNTLPAIAWSVDVIARAIQSESEAGADPVIVVLPSDHYVTEPEAFKQALAVAIAEAESNARIVTLGVPPRWAETGYGYLELTTKVDQLGVYAVERFTEKPDEEHATAFVAGGRHLWNAGIFVFRASVFVERMREFQPEILDLVEELGSVLEDASSETSERRGEIYAQMPNVSIDFGLMEHLTDIAAVPLECGWNDLGSWDALVAVLEPDEAGNFARGDTLAVSASNNLLFADEGTIAVVGVDDLVVVRTKDSVLVVKRGNAQSVRDVIAALRDAQREDLL